MSEMKNDFLQINNLTVYYSNAKYKYILNNINFKIKKGEFICLCGPNGSGKSTMISTIAKNYFSNLCIKKESDFYFNDTKLTNIKHNKFAKIVSCLVQNENTVWNYSVEDFILSGRFVHSNGFANYSKEDKIMVDNILNELSITELKGKTVHNLSGGEFQKIRIARTLIQDTPIVLLDEPAASLDFAFRFELLNILRNYAKKKNKIFLCSIHELNLATIFADKIMLLGNGNFYFDKAEKIIKPEILQQVYKINFGVFMHPEFNCLQVYPKFSLSREV
ncbi:MAG: ABC transporter ATP-binding protein [Treponema sp.]|nr:ABC transporter ATP-binding protein [Treponema sp.]